MCESVPRHLRDYTPATIFKNAMGSYAGVVVRTPSTAVMSILFAIASAALGGVLAQDYWTLDVSTAAFVYARGNSTRFKAQSDQEFGPQARMATAIVFPRDHNSSALQGAFDKQALSILYEVRETVKSIKVSSDEHLWEYDDFCQRLYGAGTACSSLSACQFWADEGAMQNDTSIGHTVGLCTDGNIPCQDSQGQPVEVAYALGRGYVQDSSGNVTSAPALFSTYLLNAVPDSEAGGGTALDRPIDAKYERAILAWEREWVRQMGLLADSLDSSGSPFQLTYGAASSLEDEISEEAHADVPIIALSYGCMSVYLVLALSSLRRPLLTTKVLVTTSTVLGVVGALLLSAGVALASAVQLNPIVFQVLPFLLLAIGVDSAFQLLDAYQREVHTEWGEPHTTGIPGSVRRKVQELAGAQDQQHSSMHQNAGRALCGESSPTFCVPRQRGFRETTRAPVAIDGMTSYGSAENPSPLPSTATAESVRVQLVANRFVSAAKDAGQSVFLSSLVQCLAFTAASFIPFEAMSAVCVFCAVGVAFNFAFFVLITLPAVALDLRRQLDGRLEVCCCAPCAANAAVARPDIIANAKAQSRLYQDLQQIEAEEQVLQQEPEPRDELWSGSSQHPWSSTAQGQGSRTSKQGTAAGGARGNSAATSLRDELLGDYAITDGSEVRALAAWVLSGLYLPLFSRKLKPLAWVVSAGFFGWWGWSAVQLSQVPVAFEQIDLLPPSSYMYSFLQAQDQFLGLGPPALLVVNGSDLNDKQQRESYQAASVALQRDVHTLSQPPFNAIGDVEWYQDYCSPVVESKLPTNATFGEVAKFFVEGDCLDVCGLPPFASCQVFNQTARCPSSLNNLDPAECASPYGLCVAALCNIRGIHATNLRWSNDNSSIVASRIQTYLQPLVSMDSYVGSMKAMWGVAGAAREGGLVLAKRANSGSNSSFPSTLQPLAPKDRESVYADSVYFEFYQQYVVLVGLAWRLFAYAGASMMGLHLLYFVDFKQSLALLIIVAGTMLTVAASLNWWEIGLNSTTVVNLVGTTGVVIELCVHLLAFAFIGAPRALKHQHKKVEVSSETDHDRASLLLAFTDGGATTLSGISATKMLGLAVLALAPSRLTRVYFLRPFLAAVAFGTLHILLLAPSLFLCALDTWQTLVWFFGWQPLRETPRAASTRSAKTELEAFDHPRHALVLPSDSLRFENEGYGAVERSSELGETKSAEGGQAYSYDAASPRSQWEM